MAWASYTICIINHSVMMSASKTTQCRQTHRQTARQTYRQLDIETDGRTDGEIGRLSGRQTETDGRTDGATSRQSDTHSQTQRQTQKHTYTYGQRRRTTRRDFEPANFFQHVLRSLHCFLAIRNRVRRINPQTLP